VTWIRVTKKEAKDRFHVYDANSDATLVLGSAHDHTLVKCGGATLAVTLPAPSTVVAGSWFRFTVTDETAATTITCETTNGCYGHVRNYNTNNNKVVIAPSTPGPFTVATLTTDCKLGDWIEFWCDGDNYLVNGESRVTAGITIS